MRIYYWGGSGNADNWTSWEDGDGCSGKRTGDAGVKGELFACVG